MIPFRDLRIGDVIPRTTPRGLMSAHAQPPTWYALQVAAQKERATVATLTRADAFAFCPMQVRQRVKNGRTTEREFPVVGRIVYARFDRVPNWDVLRDRRIITGVIAANGEPVILPAHVIRQLQGLPAAIAAYDAARDEAARVKPGDRVHVIDGPLQGLLVDVSEIRDGRLWWISALGLKGEMAAASVRKVDV